jgi:alpha-aminoadipic semialdehyde synthase
MIDGLHGLGLRLLAEGISTPLLNLPNTYMHTSLVDARAAVAKVGEAIAASDGGLLGGRAVSVVFTGNGNVSDGAKDIFEALPHEYITVSQLHSLQYDVESGARDPNKLYGVQLQTSELVRRKGKDANGKPYNGFDKYHYYTQPDDYEPIFHNTVLPHTTMLVNGMYWEPRYPRLISSKQMSELYNSGNRNLRAVADITCDIGGSVEFLKSATSVESPFFSYCPASGEAQKNVDKNCVLMMGIDNLPSGECTPSCYLVEIALFYVGGMGDVDRNCVLMMGIAG